MADLYIAVLSGFLFGVALSIIVLPLLVNRIIKKEKFNANLNLYRQLLLKKQDKQFEYSLSIRKVINSVHAALLVEHQNEPKLKTKSYKIRREPSL